MALGSVIAVSRGGCGCHRQETKPTCGLERVPPPGCTAQRVHLCLLIAKHIMVSLHPGSFARSTIPIRHIGSPRAALGSGDSVHRSARGGLQGFTAHLASSTNPRREDDAAHGDRSGAGPGMRRALGRRSAALAPAAHNLLHEPIGCRAINKRVPDCGPAGRNRCLQRPVRRRSRIGGALGFAACCRHVPPAAYRPLPMPQPCCPTCTLTAGAALWWWICRVPT